MPKKQAIGRLTDAQVMAQLKRLVGLRTWRQWYAAKSPPTPAERRRILALIITAIGTPPKRTKLTDADKGFIPPQPKLKRGERRASAEALLASLGWKKGRKR